MTRPGHISGDELRQMTGGIVPDRCMHGMLRCNRGCVWVEPLVVGATNPLAPKFAPDLPTPDEAQRIVKFYGDIKPSACPHRLLSCLSCNTTLGVPTRLAYARKVLWADAVKFRAKGAKAPWCPRCGGRGGDPEHEGACGECGRHDSPAPATKRRGKSVATAPARPQWIFSVDPGERAAWCLTRVGGRPAQTGRLRGDRAAEIARAVTVAREFLGVDSVRCVVESQTVHGKMSQVARRTLIRRAAAWVQEWERDGVSLPCVWVEPDVWQRAVLGASGRMDREARIAAAMKIATLECGNAPDSFDEAAAICIGAWAARIVAAGGVL